MTLHGERCVVPRLFLRACNPFPWISFFWLLNLMANISFHETAFTIILMKSYICVQKSITGWIMYQELWKSIGYSRKSHECFQIPQKQSHSDKYTWVADCVHQAFFDFLGTHLTIFPASMHLLVVIGHWSYKKETIWVSGSLGPWVPEDSSTGGPSNLC